MAISSKYLVIVGIMIAIGAMLLVFGSQMITQDLVIMEGVITGISEMEISAELDPENNVEGVYAIQTIEGQKYKIFAIVIDPSGLEIRNTDVTTNSFEDRFKISEKGTYKLIVETEEQNEINLVAGIGHMPDSTGTIISIIGIFVVISGMIGIVLIAVIIAKQKRKSN